MNKIFVLILFVLKICTIEKPIVVLIPSYNNAKWLKRNLDSVYAQKYSNFRVVYIDDCSTDATAELAQEYIREHKKAHCTILQLNKTRLLAMENIYKAIHKFCRDDEIVVKLDGDDWFANKNVLNKIAQEYENYDTWVTYGNYIDEPIPDDRLYCRQLSNDVIYGDLRSVNEWGSYLPGHPLTFYAKLFKEIKLKDMLYKGKFPDVAYDGFMNPPIFELSRGHFKFVNDVLYIHNCTNPLNDFRANGKKQQELAEFCALKKSYKCLNNLNFTKKSELSLIIFDYDSNVTKSQIEYLIKFENIKSITMFSINSDLNIDTKIKLINFNNKIPFVQQLNDQLSNIDTNYILFCTNINMKKLNNLNYYNHIINSTKANFLDLKNTYIVNEKTIFDKKINASQVKYLCEVFLSQLLSLSIIKKSTFQTLIKKFNGATINEFKQYCQYKQLSKNKIMLFEGDSL